MLRGLDIVGLSFADMPLQCHMEVWDITCLMQNWGGGFHFKKRGNRECVLTIEGLHYAASPGKFTPGCWRGGSDRLSNLGFRRSRVVFAQVVEQLNSYWAGHGCLAIQFTWFCELEEVLQQCSLMDSVGNSAHVWGAGVSVAILFGPCITKATAVSVFSWRKI